ncbi:hypothetical protein ATO8_11019 [Roseivivax marinus]|jgi:hypothetical protein|uniref:Sulfite reductase n=1 Tax=Roseivivax marinus TaxID=1379903 RepID=W4HIM0_9RHOB|nr:DUF2849 domain-containing protein [Roseivivax marinus]ETW12544.1 hypothetical protein ATO8_11019 [Roseivivax marinus]UMA65862.1 DUF2849 domain-containing protein [Roseivivax marinus]SEL13956.1 Protein of unknown function [Roseivivax marinus]
MPREFTPKVITANALLEGDVVYLDANGNWVRDLKQAELLTDEADAQIRLIDAEKRADEVVGVYLADMQPANDGPEPTHFREDFRRTGPSNYFLGKQAG